jgi:NTE family protein
MAEHWLAGHQAVSGAISKAGLLATNIIDGKTAAFDLSPPLSTKPGI